MSRRDFRVPVTEPRPASAWAMVALAAATLWVTQQLEPWAIAAQAAAILGSLWRRSDPFSWQSNPWVLNAFMLAITLATIAVALRGQPSTIALAHFAAMTQGLQLLDARPRRTEFLLVALALFQVALAANLTDSVFFTPLLVAFAFAAVWTLIVHTLRSEALEAGCLHELPRAFTPGLWRATLAASALSVLLAMLLFVALPRLRSSVVPGAAMGAALATAGFSDRVELGAVGRIRGDSRVVMRVETLAGEAPEPGSAYWRGLAYDTFDGRAWSITPADRQLVPGSAEGGIALGREPGRYDLVQRIVREPVEGGVLFRVGDPRGVQGPIRRLERDASGGLYAASQAGDRVRYTIRSLGERPSENALRRDRAVPPPRHGDRVLARLASSPDVAALAARIVAGSDTDADRARALERHLSEHGRYTDTPPEPARGATGSPVERFLLGEMAGHCEYFASAMVVLAREVGLPARLVNGFAGGRTNPIGGFVVLTHGDAHAWVEIHYARAGWVSYDPTPAPYRARADVPLSLADRAADLASAIELWWFQRVVGFDRADQIDALKRAWLAWRGAPQRDARARVAESPTAWRPALEPRELGAALAGCAGVIAAAVWWERRRRARDRSVHPAYRRALRLLARRGLVRPPARAARDFAREVSRALPEPPAAAFAALTEAYLAERFGSRDADAREAAARFENALRRA